MYKNVTATVYLAKWIYRSTPCSDDVMASASTQSIYRLWASRPTLILSVWHHEWVA